MEETDNHALSEGIINTIDQNYKATNQRPLRLPDVTEISVAALIECQANTLEIGPW
jgi:hypothetical protein